MVALPAVLDLPRHDAAHYQDEVLKVGPDEFKLLKAQVKAISDSQVKLAASLPAAVDASVAKRNSGLVHGSDVCDGVAAFRKDLLELQASFAQANLDKITANVASLFKNYDNSIQRQLDEIRKDLEAKSFEPPSTVVNSQINDDKICNMDCTTDHGLPRDPQFSEEEIREEEEEESEPTFGVGDYVRLCGLKSVELNNCIGTVAKVLDSNERLGIQLHAIKEHKAIRLTNLMQYVPNRNDTCKNCGEWVNLHALPPCSC